MMDGMDLIKGPLAIVRPIARDQYGLVRTAGVIADIAFALDQQERAKGLAMNGRTYDASIMFDENEAIWRAIAGVMKKMREHSKPEYIN